MPWQPGSLAGQLKSMIEEAAEHAEHCGDALVLDEIAALPLSLSGRPKWNSHSCRRGGTKKARDTAVASKALADDINHEVLSPRLRLMVGGGFLGPRRGRLRASVRVVAHRY